MLQRVSQTESAYADMLLSRASTLFEQIKKHCYMLSDVSVPYAALSDRLSTGLWTRKLIGKLFSGSSDYIAYVRLDMNGCNALLILRIHALSRLPLNVLHYCVYIQ